MMSILQKLKAIRLGRRNHIVEQDVQQEQQQEEEEEQQREGVVFEIPRKSRPPSIFIQLGTFEPNQNRAEAEEELPIDENKEDYEALIMKVWEEPVDDDSEFIKFNNNTGEDRQRRKVAVRQSRILSVLSFQAREISQAREERRPVSLIIAPTKSAMRSVEKGASKREDRRSLTIVDPRDPLNPHPVICRKEFLEELRAQDRLSFNSSDFKLNFENKEQKKEQENEQEKEKNEEEKELKK